MVEQRTRYGGAGNRNPNRKAYDGHVRPDKARPLPPEFRDLYIRHGWDAQYFLATNWRVMVRWIEEAGGDELREARRHWLRTHGRNNMGGVRHAKGWDARRLSQLEQKRPPNRGPSSD
jgi:hypothetical protein